MLSKEGISSSQEGQLSNILIFQFWLLMLMRTNQVFDPSYKEAIKRAYSKPQIALTASNVGYLIRIWTKIVYMHIK